MPEQKRYTVEEANALLPWLTDHLARTRDAARKLGASQARVRRLLDRGRRNGHYDISYELSIAEDAAARDMRETQSLLGQLTARGLEVRDIRSGLVDFRSERDGREVWLCWRLDEPAVAHWHAMDTGFDDRRPV